MAAPDGLSRLTIISTLAPLVIIWSAMVAILVLSPSAFWMSYWTPAALNASPRYLRSAVSQRADDFESGRITPILPLTAPPPAAVVVAPAAAVVALAAVVAALAAVVAPPLLLLLLSLPQAARPSVNAVATAVNP